MALSRRWIVPQPSLRLLTFDLIGLVWIVASTGAAIPVPELRNVTRERSLKVVGVF